MDTVAAPSAGEGLDRHGPGSLFDRRHRLTTFGAVLVVTVIALEAMAVATVLPSTVRSLHGMPLYGWAFTAFFIANVMGIVDAGGRADRHGPRLPLIAGLALFGAGLLAAGSAPDMAVFLAGRALQGFGAGWTVVALYVVIAKVYHERLRPPMFAALSAAWVLPALVGPVAAGAVADAVGWRPVFAGLVPAAGVGALILVPALRSLDREPRGVPAAPDPVQGAGNGRRRRPLPGVRVATGLALAQVGTQHLSWWSLPTLAAAVLLAVPALGELLPAGALRLRRGLPATVTYRGLLSATFFTVEAYVPLTLVEVHRFGPMEAGIPLTASALGWSTASWLQGRRREGRPRAPLIWWGLLLVCAADAGLAVVTFPRVQPWLSVAFWALGGAGMGFAYPTTSVLTLSLSPEDQQGVNSAALQVCDQTGAIGGIALAGAILGIVDTGNSAAAGLAVVDVTMAVAALAAALAWTRVGPVEERQAPAG